LRKKIKTLEKEICDEVWKLMEDSALAKSCVVNDTDLSLLTAEELQLIFKLNAQLHPERAREVSGQQELRTLISLNGRRFFRVLSSSTA